MATRKKKPAAKTTPVKRRKRRTAKAAPRKRRRTTLKKKGMLSELFNPMMASAGFKSTLSGAVGGGAAGLLENMFPETMNEKTRSYWLIGGGFLLATVGKVPNVGAGMAGVGTYQLMGASGYLGEHDENEDFMYAEEIENLPPVLDENGMDSLQEEEEYYEEDMEDDLLDEDDYLQEEDDYLQDEQDYLQEGEYGVGYYPNFGGQ